MQEHTCVKWSHFRACYQNFDTTFNLNACEHVKKHSYKTFALPWKQDLMFVFFSFLQLSAWKAATLSMDLVKPLVNAGKFIFFININFSFWASKIWENGLTIGCGRIFGRCDYPPPHFFIPWMLNIVKKDHLSFLYLIPRVWL